MPQTKPLGKGAGAVMLCGITGAALFYGDAMITPALSVLSAIEGLKVATPAFDRYVVPLTMLILVLLFAFQSRGIEPSLQAAICASASATDGYGSRSSGGWFIASAM